MDKGHEVTGERGEKGCGLTATQRQLSRGVKSLRHLANTAGAIIQDTVFGLMGTREASVALSGVREVRRTVQVGQQIGENRQVVDIGGPDGQISERELELEAELRSIRERRGSV